MLSQAGAIVWAQWRSVRNHLPRANVAGLIFTSVLTALWYGGFAYVAVIVGFLLTRRDELAAFHKILPGALLICFLYWQVVPVLLTSMGASLDLRKLLVYPIPHGTLFIVEVLLRVTTGLEMLLLFAGAAIGLLFNPAVPFWAPFTLAVFVLFNLFCATGVRDLLVRLLARKRIREIIIFLFVIAAALPQLMLFRRVARPGPPVLRQRAFRVLAVDCGGAPGAGGIYAGRVWACCWFGPSRPTSLDAPNLNAVCDLTRRLRLRGSRPRAA